MSPFILRILFDRSFISYDLWELLLKEILDNINLIPLHIIEKRKEHSHVRANRYLACTGCAREVACESWNYVTHVG